MALKLLEDLGCEVVDNIPIALCKALISEKNTETPLAIGLDFRTRDFTAEKFYQCVEDIRVCSGVTVVFLDAITSVLCARYRETRRGHPLGISAHIEELVEIEKKLLAPIKDWADIIFDTSSLSPPEMRAQLQQHLNISSLKLWVYILSFSFRRGIPTQSDFVFDMRFLPNPHYDVSMRTLTGEHKDIQSYFMEHIEFSSFIQYTKSLFSDLIFPTYTEDRRLNCTISFGCTGGRHRSVGTAEVLAQQLMLFNYNVRVYHRDL